MRLVPLGTNGFMPSFGRQTMSFLLLTSSEAILLDAGTGVARLLEQPIIDLLSPYDRLNVVLSHYHLDHVVGLSYLSGVWTRGTVRIYAPGRPFVEAVPEQALGRLLRPPLFSLALQGSPTAVEVVTVTRDDVRIGTLSIRLRAQEHPGGSAGIRIGDTIAYITDTIVEHATETFVQGVGFLLHEVWLTDSEAESDDVERSRHSYASGVAEIAMRAKVDRLVPVHNHPKRSDAGILKLAQGMKDVSGIEVVVPEEGRVYAVG